jgi:hypothetical protein
MMIRCRRASVAAGLSIAVLTFCAGASTAGDAPAPPPPPAPSRAMQRDIDAVNRLLRERQMQLAPPPAAGVTSERAPLGAPAAPRPIPATVRPAPAPAPAPTAAPAAPRTPSPDPGVIASAIRRLADETPAERVAARKELRAAGAAAVPALIDALEDGNETVSLGAVAVLGQIRDPRAAEPLARLLDDPSTRMWAALSGAFNALKGEAAPALIDALGSHDDTVRSRVVELMGSIADPRFADPLIERLNRDRDSLVRMRMAGALGQIGERSACEALLVMLDEP